MYKLIQVDRLLRVHLSLCPIPGLSLPTTHVSLLAFSCVKHHELGLHIPGPCPSLRKSVHEFKPEQRWEPRREAASWLIFVTFLKPPSTTCLGMALFTVGQALPHNSTIQPRKYHVDMTTSQSNRSSSSLEVLSSQVPSLCQVGNLTSMPGMKQNINASWSALTGGLLFPRIFCNLECPSQFQLRYLKRVLVQLRESKFPQVSSHMFSVKAGTHFLCVLPLSNETLRKVNSQTKPLSSPSLAFCWAILNSFCVCCSKESASCHNTGIPGSVICFQFLRLLSCRSAHLRRCICSETFLFQVLGRAWRCVHKLLSNWSLQNVYIPSCPPFFPLPLVTSSSFIVPLLHSGDLMHAEYAHRCLSVAPAPACFFLIAFKVYPRCQTLLHMCCPLSLCLFILFPPPHSLPFLLLPFFLPSFLQCSVVAQGLADAGQTLHHQ